MSFVNANITTDPVTLLDTAVDSINTNLTANGYPGWTANDASLAVIILGTVAEMIADASTMASTVLAAVFRAFGTQLLGIPYQNAVSAIVSTVWTFTGPAPADGYEIDEGTTVMIDGQAFYTQSPYTSNTGDTTATLTLIASQGGVAYNDLGGVGVGYPRVQLLNSIDFVSSVVTQGITSGGEDQETDDDYQNRLAAVLELQTPRPVVAADFAGMVLSDIAENATGVAVGRATSIDGYFPDGRALSTGGAGSTVLSCTLTSASATVQYAGSGNQAPETGATVTGTGVAVSTFTASTTSGSDVLSSVSSFSSLGVGTLVSGTGIPAGAQITAIDTGASTATMGVPATATGTGVTVTPEQTVLAGATDMTFTMSAPATTTGAESLTVSALTGYGPTHLTCTGSLTSGSPTGTISTAPYLGAIPDIAARITGTGIPTGATILASPAPGTTGFTMSANASASETNETITISSWTSVSLATTTFVTDADGNALTAAQMDALETWLQGCRPTNWLVFVTAPSYTTIYVSVLVKVLPGYVASSVQSAVQAALLGFLSAATWGNPDSATGGAQWLNSGNGYNLVRYKQLIQVAGSVQGVQYVDTLTLGTGSSPSGTSDLTLAGPAPLPLSSSSTIVVSTE